MELWYTIFVKYDRVFNIFVKIKYSRHGLIYKSVEC